MILKQRFRCFDLNNHWKIFWIKCMHLMLQYSSERHSVLKDSIPKVYELGAKLFLMLFLFWREKNYVIHTNSAMISKFIQPTLVFFKDSQEFFYFIFVSFYCWGKKINLLVEFSSQLGIIEALISEFTLSLSFNACWKLPPLILTIQLGCIFHYWWEKEYFFMTHFLKV